MHDIYKHNWYKRNTETYNYGNPVRLNEHFTGALYSLNEVTSMLSNSKTLSTELKEIISNRFGIKPALSISDDADTSYTDGKKIVVAKNGLDKISDPFKQLDLLYGFAFHETAHCVYTDFNHITYNGVVFNPVVKYIHNVLEDEEIELRMSKHYPGYARYFAYLKHIIFEQGTCAKETLQEERVNQLDEIMAIFFCLIRFPKYIDFIDEKLLDKYADVFIKINDILVNEECPMIVPFTECEMNEDIYYDCLSITDKTIRASFEIYKYLQRYILEDFKNQEKEFGENENSMGNKMPGFGMPSGTCESGDEVVISTLSSMLDDDFNSGNTIGTNISTRGDKVRTPNPDAYYTMLNEMRPYIDVVSKTVIPNDVKVKDNLTIHRFRRNGNLDTNRLADAMQNINTVYTQRMNKPMKVNNAEPKFAFVMMIDESGSMDSMKRTEFAHNMSVLYAEIFSKFKGVEYYVYGHGDKINAYLTKEKTNKYVLGNYDRQGNQNDAFAYKWIINDVKRQTNLPIIVLNITDFYYHSSDKDLTNVIRYYKENNVSFNMITLGTQYKEREINFTKRLLNGQVINMPNLYNKESLIDGFTELSTMIRKNYERFNRK